MKKLTPNQFRKVNDIRRHFDRSTRADVININSGNTIEHELTKCYLCIQLAKQGRHFLTEATFSNHGIKGRADIVDLSTGRILEIVESESETSILRKKSYYPLPVRAVRARKHLEVG